MTSLSEKLKNRFFRDEDHPYRIFERLIHSHLKADHVLLDAGCGRGAPVISKFIGKAKRVIGVELVDFTPKARESGVELLNNDLSQINVDSECVDIVISRSVLEHIPDIEPVYMEIHRILKPGGKFLFLVPNLWDYVSLVSYFTPNKFHAWIVTKLEGRSGLDTFPTFYKSNSRASVTKLASQTGFKMNSFVYVGQYPSMFLFNPFLFFLATVYEKVITKIKMLNFLRGWILVELEKIGDSPIAPGQERAAASSNSDLSLN
jgi:SAM-dependent methyltransferase